MLIHHSVDSDWLCNAHSGVLHAGCWYWKIMRRQLWALTCPILYINCQQLLLSACYGFLSEFHLLLLSRPAFIINGSCLSGLHVNEIITCVLMYGTLHVLVCIFNKMWLVSSNHIKAKSECLLHWSIHILSTNNQSISSYHFLIWYYFHRQIKIH